MRRKFLIPLTLAVGVLALGHLTGIKNYQRVSADALSYQTYVPVRTGWIERTDNGADYYGLNETDFNKYVRGRNERFWWGNADPNNWDSQERTFNAVDDFIDSVKEGGNGARINYRTPELTLTDRDHRYICFNYSGLESNDIFINVFNVTKGHDAVTNVKTFFRETPNGTFDDNKGKVDSEKKYGEITCNQTFRYIELPEDIETGNKFLLYVHDGSQAGFGFFTFGGLYINQTLSDVARHFSVHKTQMLLNKKLDTSAWNNNAIDYVLDFYNSDDYYAPIRELESFTDANDDFEVNTNLSNWGYDQLNSTYENGDYASLNYSYIYSDKVCKWGSYFYDNDGRMPTNKTGNLFLSGEPEGMDGPNCGLPETAKYRLVSHEFTLSGTGLISAKIGGHFTALQLLDSSFNVIATTGDVNPSFVDADITNIAQSGARLNTMVRTYLDCGAFVGQRVHVALADTRTGGNWNLAYFDEVITYYENNPAFQVDVFQQHIGKSESDFYHGYILDQYVDNGHNSVFKEAFDFLQVYYANFRSPTNGFDIAQADDDAKLAVANAYLPLSSDAKTLIGQSVDVRYTEVFNEATWFNNAVNVESKVPESDIATLKTDLVTAHGTSTVTFNANGGTGSMAAVTVINTTKYSSFVPQFTAPAGKKFAGWNTASDGSGLSTAVAENVALYAIWVDTAVTTLEATDSISAFRFHYVESGSDYLYSDAALRFGALISADVWEDLKTEGTIEGYGVIVVKTASLTGTIKSNYEAAEGADVEAKLTALCASGTFKKASVDGDTPAEATDDQKTYMGVSGDYYIWQVRQNIGQNFTTEYTSVAYIKVSGRIIFLQETTCSAKGLATSKLPSVDPAHPSHDPIQFMAEH